VLKESILNQNLMILIKLWLLVYNRWCSMLGYSSVINFQYVYMFCLFISGLNLDPHCWVLVEYSSFVLYFSRLWSVLTKTILSLFFASLIRFRFWFVFWVKLVVFGSIYDQMKGFGSTWSGQSRVKWLRPCFGCNGFAKYFLV